MKKYTSQPNEDLGSIAKKFGMPSWKYLYQLNKEKIGDNPDLLQNGTELDIPEWDTTSGDEKIAAKGINPFAYTGGVSYRYPWVPFSLTFLNESSEIVQKNDGGDSSIRYKIQDNTNSNILASGEIGSGDALEILLPDSSNFSISLDGNN